MSIIMLLRYLVVSVVALGLGLVTATPPRLADIAGNPRQVRRFCEIGMKDARWQDPPFFRNATIAEGKVVVQITGDHILFVCPVTGGTKSHLVTIAECPKDPRRPCRARRHR